MSGNFNYIAFGNRERVEGEVQSITMNRGRMFEYTPSDMEKRLEVLDAEAVAFMEKLPTFLCSEIERSKDEAVMVIKYGRIANIQAGTREVSGDFETLIDFGEVDFTTLENAREVFAADGFQLHRTHWAVREGDAQEILAQLSEIAPALTGAVDEFGQPDEGAAEVEPPPRSKKIIGDADSVEAFLQHLYGLEAKDGTETFFRGHEDENFELTPSLLRKHSDGSWMFMPSEDRLCKELLIAHDDEFHVDAYCFDRLVRMQHFGLPTRLLDISLNPLVALFFACVEMPEATGEVIIFRVSSSKVKYWDSDTASCLANLSNLTYEQKNEIDLALAQEAFNATPVIQKLLHHIKSEKGFFEGRIVPDDLGSILCVKAKKTNTRIKSQSGAFLLFGHEAVLPDVGQKDIEISRVRIVDKHRILDQLDRININATTVYPSIDQTAKHLKSLYLEAREPQDPPVS